MAVTVTSTKEAGARADKSARRPVVGGGFPAGGPRGPRGGGPGGDDLRGRDLDSSLNSYRIGMWVALASVVMLFTALTSAYVVRLGWSNDWRPTAAPSFLWASTALIVAGSWTMARAQRGLRQHDEAGSRRWLTVTLLVGLGFVAAQLLAWRQLVAQGVYLKSNPHGSFFYVLTAVHGLHVLGGLAGLALLLLWRAPSGREARARRRSAFDAVTLYWHFMDGLWIYLFLLLFLWR